MRGYCSEKVYTPKGPAMLIAVSLLLAPCLARGDATHVKVALLHKLLSYDRALKGRSGPRVRIVVVIDSETTAHRSRLVKSFALLAKREIQGKPVSIDVVSFEQEKGLEATAKGATVVYLPDGTAGATVAAAVKVADRLGVPLVAGGREPVKRGAALGLPIDDGHAKIVVNIKAARRQRLDLPAGVLRLAEVIR